MDTNIYQSVEDNWNLIQTSLVARNVFHTDIIAMREAYCESVMARHRGEATSVEFYVSNSAEQNAIIFLEDRDFLVYKKHCGRAVVKEQVK